MSVPTEEDDLDFTKPAKPSPPPPPERMAKPRRGAPAGRPGPARRGFSAARAKPPPTPLAPRNGSRHTVFVVEDDPHLLKLVGEVLSGEGFLTRFARNRNEINAEFNKAPLP